MSSIDIGSTFKKGRASVEYKRYRELQFIYDNIAYHRAIYVEDKTVSLYMLIDFLEICYDVDKYIRALSFNKHNIIKEELIYIKDVYNKSITILQFAKSISKNCSMNRSKERFENRFKVLLDDDMII